MKRECEFRSIPPSQMRPFKIETNTIMNTGPTTEQLEHKLNVKIQHGLIVTGTKNMNNNANWRDHTLSWAALETLTNEPKNLASMSLSDRVDSKTNLEQLCGMIVTIRGLGVVKAHLNLYESSHTFT